MYCTRAVFSATQYTEGSASAVARGWGTPRGFVSWVRRLLKTALEAARAIGGRRLYYCACGRGRPSLRLVNAYRCRLSWCGGEG